MQNAEQVEKILPSDWIQKATDILIARRNPDNVAIVQPNQEDAFNAVFIIAEQLQQLAAAREETKSAQQTAREFAETIVERLHYGSCLMDSESCRCGKHKAQAYLAQHKGEKQRSVAHPPERREARCARGSGEKNT